MRRIRLGLLTAGALALLAAGSESARANDCDSLRAEGQKVEAEMAKVWPAYEQSERGEGTKGPNSGESIAKARADYSRVLAKMRFLSEATIVLKCGGEEAASPASNPAIPADMEKLIDAIGGGVREQLENLRNKDRPAYDARIASLRKAANLPPLPPAPGGSAGSPATASSPQANLEELIITLGPGSAPSGAGLTPGSAEPPLVIPELPADTQELIRKLRQTDPQRAEELERKLNEENRKEAIERRRREAAEEQKKREASLKPVAPASTASKAPAGNACLEGQVRLVCAAADGFGTDGCQPASTVQSTMTDFMKKHSNNSCKIDGVAQRGVPPTHNASKIVEPGQKCPKGSRFEVCRFGAGDATIGCVEPQFEGFFCKGQKAEMNCKCEQQDTNANVPPFEALVALRAVAPALLPPKRLDMVAPSLLPPPMLASPQIAAAPPAVLHTPPQPPAVLHTPPQPPPEHVVPTPPKQQKQAARPRPQRQAVNRGQTRARAQAQAGAQAQAEAQAQNDAAAAAAAAIAVGAILGIAGAAASGPSYHPGGYAPAHRGH